MDVSGGAVGDCSCSQYQAWCPLEKGNLGEMLGRRAACTRGAGGKRGKRQALCVCLRGAYPVREGACGIDLMLDSFPGEKQKVLSKREGKPTGD